MLQSARTPYGRLILPVDSATIRQKFVDYFVEYGHLHLPGLPLVTNDPNVTTLFTIAGMQQMIPYFLGQEEPPSRNIVTVQKSVRTVDIEDVGDLSHHTFLEMLGNFSVGDYFKREAIHYTWDFLVNRLGIPAERWWAATYPGDEEARQAWIDTGMPGDRIGETPDNWWGPPGTHGPCGPNSEIHFDRGIEYSCGRPDCRPETECCDRFLEVWNDVFMQYYQEEDGTRRPLPWNNIDTGMGFERLVTIVQGKETAYETDLFEPIIRSLTELSGKAYGEDARTTRSLRIVADHSRAFTLIISDGVMPSSEGRGYVVRRLIRRAVLHGRLLGIEQRFLKNPTNAAIDVLGGYYTELLERREHILTVVEQEERRFQETLSRGLSLFEDMAQRAGDDGKIIAGADAFLLYDTHGFPLELTSEMAGERGLEVDREAFEGELQEQRRRARAGQKYKSQAQTLPEIYAELAKTVPATVFTGYDELGTTTEVVAILAEGRPVSRAEAGDRVEIVLAATPFYAEAGGQVGDTGSIRADGGLARVDDTQRHFGGIVSHRAEIVNGAISVGDAIDAEVDAERRLHILPHHSGTHLVHKALQDVLGPEATQAGSLVAPDRLRFDFRWPRSLTADELREVQDRVNAAIWANLPVRAEIMSYDEAIQEGAMALFGEKYRDRVRVVNMGNWSKELCGGTHVDATGDIGMLLITSESGIGSGVRRIEALAGAAAYAYVNDLEARVQAAAVALETKPENIVTKAQQLTQQVRQADRRVASLTQQLAAREADALVKTGQPVDRMTVVADRISSESVDFLEATTDAVRAKLDRGIVVLAAVVDGKPTYTMAVTKNLKDEGYQANVILREAASQAGAGGAGGNPEFARGGGKDASKLDAILSAAVEIIKKQAAS